MLDLAIQGFNTTEIAALIGRHRITVSRALRSPWGREYMIKQSQKNLAQEIQTLLETEALPSIQKLIDTRDNVLARPETQVSAANSLLDRLLGKAAQPIITTKIDTTKATDDELTAIIRRSSSGVGAETPNHN